MLCQPGTIYAHQPEIHLAMLQNYLVLAARNLRRNARYLCINVLGLGIALGFCILSYLNHRFANTYDHWHRDGGRIVRAEMVKASNGEPFGVCPGAIGPAAAADLPGVEAMLRYETRGSVVKRGDAVFNEGIHFADDNFFQFFDFQLLHGSLDLRDHNRVVLDETAAAKFFGTENPIGQTLIFYADTDRKLPLTVGGVVKKIPLNSSVRFRFLTHLDNAFEGHERTDFNAWKRAIGAVFLRLKTPGDFAAVRDGLQAYTAPRNTARPDWQVSAYRLERFPELAATSRELRSNMLWHGVPPAAIWGNLVLSALLLLTAALNFSNMTISACNRRLREIGVRKVMGGTRWQLMRQMLTEALVVVGLATALGMALAFPICDWFNGMWKFTDLRPDYREPGLLAFLVAAVAGTTLLAGSYPAFYITAFQPSSIFRGGQLFGGKNVFSRAMMGLQVAISILSMVVGLSFARNAELNRTADLGFEHRPVLQAWLPGPGDFQKFNDAVRDIPGVSATAGSVHLPGFGFIGIEFQFRGEPQEAFLYQIGNGFTDLMQLRLAEGAWPLPAGDTSASPEIVVNQTLARRLGDGSRSVVGEQIVVSGAARRISGVVVDFMTDTPFNPIGAAMLHPVTARESRRCLLKTVSAEAQPQVMAAVEQRWKGLFPYTPFNVGYQSEMLKEAIEVSENVSKSMRFFSLVAVLLSVAGLFSLVSLNVLRRMREVAVRRVLGASAGQVAWILNKNYVLVFALAVVAGCGGGWFFARMLMDSIFKINFGVPPGALVFSALGMLAVAVLTIGGKVWQALRVNPAEILRSE